MALGPGTPYIRMGSLQAIFGYNGGLSCPTWLNVKSSPEKLGSLDILYLEYRDRKILDKVSYLISCVNKCLKHPF